MENKEPKIYFNSLFTLLHDHPYKIMIAAVFLYVFYTTFNPDHAAASVIQSLEAIVFLVSYIMLMINSMFLIISLFFLWNHGYWIRQILLYSSLPALFLLLLHVLDMESVFIVKLFEDTLPLYCALMLIATVIICIIVKIRVSFLK